MKTKTLRLYVAAFLLLLPGCGCFTSVEIECWYPTPATNSCLPMERWFALRGRTAKFREDVYGPTFKTQEELDTYVRTNNLRLCGSEKK